jgi:hypothetical protein
MTATITAVSLLFTVIAMIDFAAGLVTTWRNAAVKAQLPAQSIPVIEQLAAQDQVVEFQGESASTLPNPWTLPAEEMPIALQQQQANSIKPLLQLPPALEVAEQPETGDYSQLSIRQLKRLASGKVKGYSNLTKPQLIAALTTA